MLLFKSSLVLVLLETGEQFKSEPSQWLSESCSWSEASAILQRRALLEMPGDPGDYAIAYQRTRLA